jgi:hypothetical protein
MHYATRERADCETRQAANQPGVGFPDPGLVKPGPEVPGIVGKEYGDRPI